MLEPCRRKAATSFASNGDDALRCYNRLTFLLEPAVKIAASTLTNVCNQTISPFVPGADFFVLLQPANFSAGLVGCFVAIVTDDMFFLLEPATFFAGTVFVFCYHASFCFAGMNTKLLQICYHWCFDLLEPAPVFATMGIFELLEQHPIFHCLLPLAFQFAGTSCIFCYHCCLLRAMVSSPLILQGTGGWQHQ